MPFCKDVDTVLRNLLRRPSQDRQYSHRDEDAARRSAHPDRHAARQIHCGQSVPHIELFETHLLSQQIGDGYTGLRPATLSGEQGGACDAEAYGDFNLRDTKA